MAKKAKRRARTKKANPTRKRATHRRKKRRANPANPPSRKRRASHRRRSNPRRARRAHARSTHRTSRRNPSRRRRTSHRRRNPGGPIVQAAIGLAVGAAAFVLSDVVTYYVTKDMAAHGQRNRKIVGALAVGGGLYLARKHPLIGLGLAAGGLLSGFGNMLMLSVLKILPAKGPSAVGAVAYQDMAAIATNNMQGYQLEAGSPLGAVAYQDMAGWETMGDPVPAAPWENDGPFQ